MKVSIIILNYNGRDDILNCLKSVYHLDYPQTEYEVIVVDNHSMDGSPDLVREKFPAVQLVLHEKNYGFAEGNNLAVPRAQGKYLAFLNQDVEVHKDWLNELVRNLESQPDVAACHSNMIMPWVPEFRSQDHDKAPRGVYYYELTCWGFTRYVRSQEDLGPIETLHLSGASMIVKRDLLDIMGYLFDPDFFLYSEDLDLALRIHSLGYRILLIPGSVVYHHQKKSSSQVLRNTRRTHRAIKNRIIAFYKNMYPSEFILFLPFLLMGSPLKVREFHMPWPKKLLYGIVMIPLTITGFLGFLWDHRTFAPKRETILAARVHERFWLRKRTIAKQ